MVIALNVSPNLSITFPLTPYLTKNPISILRAKLLVRDYNYISNLGALSNEGPDYSTIDACIFLTKTDGIPKPVGYS